MNREHFLESIDFTEKLYRDLFYYNPAVFETPVRSWAEFCDRWTDENIRKKLPENPPTIMGQVFRETEYFPRQQNMDVSIIVNAKYCPAFLHKLEFIKVIYIFRGNCLFFMDGKRFEMSEGNVCIVAPGVEQTVFSCSDEDVVLNLLIRRSTFAEAFSELLEIDDGGIIADFFWRMLYHKPGGEMILFGGKPIPLIEESIMELYEEIHHKPAGSGLVMKSIMMSVFAYILRWYGQSVIYQKEGSKKRYSLALYMQYMKKNMEGVSLRTLAEEFKLSEGYLSRYFRKETGVTFSRCLQEMRMKRAAELLVKTDCNIERITELVGYTDQSAFFRNFKETYGMTPVQFRKRKRKLQFVDI